MAEVKLQWHPAFVAALHIEFEEELDVLEIEPEHQLGKKPMQIDALVIKKVEDTPIRKNIGRIFRKHNIIEYKSPEDSLSIDDFYKAYGYTCFYKSDTEKVNEIKPEELTVTYVCNHYPRKMLRQLESGRRLTVERKGRGIYYLGGDEFPIQILVTKELSKEDNYWMQSLRNDLKAGAEIENLAERYEVKRRNPYYQAVMDLIVRANCEEMEESKGMCKAILELFADEYEQLRKEDAEKMAEHLAEMEKQMQKAQEEIQKEMQKAQEDMQKEMQKVQEDMQKELQRVQEEAMSQGESRAKRIFKLFADGTPLDLIAEKCGVSVEKVQQVLE